MPLGLNEPESFGDYTDPVYNDPGGQPAAPAPGPAPGPTQPPPVEEPAPGPEPAPAVDQTGVPGRVRRNRTLPPAPPPTPVPGVQASDTTGGVQGSFAQAGTRGFGQRFGTQAPALWYRRNLESLGGHETFQQQQSARSGGGVQGTSIPAPSSEAGDEGDSIGGRPGDQDYQRLLRQVMDNMFKQGG